MFCTFALCKLQMDVAAPLEPDDPLAQPTRARLFALLGELKRPAGRAYLPRTPVSLAFELPDGGDLVQVQGAIVFERAASDGFQTSGVRFLALSPLDHARIQRLLRYL